MNVLVIGNGFDLALGYPTKYTDFLDFIKIFNVVYRNESYDYHISPIQCINDFTRIPDEALPANIRTLLPLWNKFNKALNSDFIYRAFWDFKYCTCQNSWIDYFLYRYEEKLLEGENWIDLEKEIKDVIKLLENNSLQIERGKAATGEFEIAYGAIQNLIIDILNLQANDKRFHIKIDVYTALKKRLEKDFDKFIMALGIYLDFFVSQVDIGNKFSKDIYSLMKDKKIDYVLSFNYINNYNRCYSGEKDTEDNTCYVHGASTYRYYISKFATQKLCYQSDEEFIEDCIEKNKMVIGFDEYICEDKEKLPLDFVYYRKYFQRISKGTERKFTKWLDEYRYVENDTPPDQSTFDNLFAREDIRKKKPNNVFVFGHSLDDTDRDIFRKLLLREANDTKVTIYYHNKEAKHRIMANLIRMLSREVFNEKAYAENPDIVLVEQSN